MPRGEDDVVKGMRLGALNDPNLYIYHVHGANTWARAPFEKVFIGAEARDDLKVEIDERLAWTL
jgi:hypothetical protein